MFGFSALGNIENMVKVISSSVSIILAQKGSAHYTRCARTRDLGTYNKTNIALYVLTRLSFGKTTFSYTEAFVYSREVSDDSL